MHLSPKLSDFAERAGWSAGQAFFATLLAEGGGRTVVSLPWKYALIIAAGAALTSVVLTELQYLGKETNLSFWPDILVRTAKTFLGSLAGAFAAAHPFNVVTFHWPSALNLAAVAALTCFGKGMLAGGSGEGQPVALYQAPDTATLVAGVAAATSAAFATPVPAAAPASGTPVAVPVSPPPRRSPSTLSSAVYDSAVRQPPAKA